ncbi:similar to Saccharomyces cerevisiae YEL003W GIM4 Subunit of the heterohexameric cochaperone prefoldin complex which binds specifically to cytosolic chaperonin and transfers target proteins to it [Geotrichum candidum]|uniref:Similar to Saccharomyces cerevisiae YEL003W GIM4 Subunit of the heterohexameric cochaperone prefoldin complex which binds specifically to cytosolic chaperonin and transfers target proteins to it n=1 Tax=Geotrichum candidum TaxID=1173061 RepID=A0A0J9XBE1_GEOCN|nr:similar to Saccharomyces cerevisiae YEL003W GIM4 Subunit of the heterohexameric cochaperone prefoldin complex which binds specifically to cytosolic chaperonin and transfers target proteins to it [Geotrichum candidum]
MSTTAAAPSTPARPPNAELQQQYNTFKSTLTQLSTKIAELESELDEHKLVVDTLKETPADRKCFRMIGGVLVEKSVKEVLPALQTNSQGLTQVIDTLRADMKRTETELRKWQKQYNVQIVQSNQ